MSHLQDNQDMPLPPFIIDEHLNQVIATIFELPRLSPWNLTLQRSMLLVLRNIILVGLEKGHTAQRISAYCERFPQIWIDAVIQHGFESVSELITAEFYINAEWEMHDEMTEEEFTVHCDNFDRL